MLKTAIILCAGKQTRFNSDIPKSIFQFSDENNITPLDLNISSISKYVDEIIVVSSKEKEKYFKKFENLEKNIRIVSIESGFGCGDAVMKSLKYASNDDILLIWGDSVQTEENIKELYSNSVYSDSCVYVPVVLEKSPYVQFVSDENMKIKQVRFSKYHDMIDEYGFHDLSFFRFSKSLMSDILLKYSEKIKSNDEFLYRTSKGNEMIFLEIFNEYNNIESKLIDLSNNKNVKCYSYNTIKEFIGMKKHINFGNITM